MHLKRVIVAVILVPLFYLYIMHLPSEFFLFMLAFISTAALVEFYTMSRLEGFLKYAGLLCGGGLLLTFYTARHLFMDAVLFSVLALMALRLFLKRDAASSLSEASIAVLGILYIPGLLSFQLDLFKAGPGLIIFLYVSVWTSDSMAYYIGKGIGKRKLYKEISPNKTVAGAVGSVFGGVIGAGIIRATILDRITLTQGIILGAAIGFTTIIGDLAESMFKRDAGVKDSSQLLPGHGGVLDKIDGVTFAGPVFYWICKGLGIIG